MENSKRELIDIYTKNMAEVLIGGTITNVVFGSGNKNYGFVVSKGNKRGDKSYTCWIYADEGCGNIGYLQIRLNKPLYDFRPEREE